MKAAVAPVQISWPVRVSLTVISLMVSIALAECAVRVVDGNALDGLNLWERTEEAPEIRLQPAAQGRARSAAQHPYTTFTGPEGLRVRSVGDAQPWDQADQWVLGDSVVFGQGVAAEETFWGILRPTGRVLIPVATPGWGVRDSLARASALLRTYPAPPDGLVLVINPTNDFHDAERPLTQRQDVIGGWLVAPDRTRPWQRWFFAGPWAHSHLLHRGAVALSRAVQPPLAPHAPNVAAALQEIDAAVQAFVHLNPAVSLRIVLGGSLDTPPHGSLAQPPRISRSPSGRDGIPAWAMRQKCRWVSGHFLNGDTHLSLSGHEGIAVEWGASIGWNACDAPRTDTVLDSVPEVGAPAD